MVELYCDEVKLNPGLILDEGYESVEVPRVPLKADRFIGLGN